jgi:hypothetical protein
MGLAGEAHCLAQVLPWPQSPLPQVERVWLQKAFINKRVML